ncbi:MAG: glycosyltransferase [Bacteroidota bacterium]
MKPAPLSITQGRMGLFTPGIRSKKLGATKNRLEFAEALQKLGWNCEVITATELAQTYHLQGRFPQPSFMTAYAESLKAHLQANKGTYNAVLYEADSLPFDRKLFDQDCLMIARPALLWYQRDRVQIPEQLKWTSRLKRWLKGPQEQKRQAHLRWTQEKTMLEADLVQVQNDWDKKVLIEKGFDPNCILVVPNGITPERRALFDQSRSTHADALKIAFVGTFDFRKGATDFGDIFRRIRSFLPEARLKLMGTKGMFQTPAEVLAFFTGEDQPYVEVIPAFEPNELPTLLADCALGLFPSYWESFGYGALEMMAASLPVLAYRSPGPAMFVPEDWQVAPGDTHAMALKAVHLLKDSQQLVLARSQAHSQSLSYQWEDIARQALADYQVHFSAPLISTVNYG